MGYRTLPASRGAETGMEPVLRRLQGEGAFPPELAQRVRALGARVDTLPARAIVQVENAPARRPRYLISGWACRYRHLRDGRKQIFDLVLPGEGVDVGLRIRPLAAASVAAITPVRVVNAAPLLAPEVLESWGELAPALQAQEDAEDRRLLDHVVRLGRLTALERLAHIALDLRARLEVIGHAESGRFPLPLTQETLADMAGLSVVHVNRTLQELRRQNLVVIDRGWAHLPDVPALQSLAHHERP